MIADDFIRSPEKQGDLPGASTSAHHEQYRAEPVCNRRLRTGEQPARSTTLEIDGA